MLTQDIQPGDHVRVVSVTKHEGVSYTTEIKSVEQRDGYKYVGHRPHSAEQGSFGYFRLYPSIEENPPYAVQHVEPIRELVKTSLCNNRDTHRFNVTLDSDAFASQSNATVVAKFTGGCTGLASCLDFINERGGANQPGLIYKKCYRIGSQQNHWIVVAFTHSFFMTTGKEIETSG